LQASPNPAGAADAAPGPDLNPARTSYQFSGNEPGRDIGCFHAAQRGKIRSFFQKDTLKYAA
jgi:hypothetical protein